MILISYGTRPEYIKLKPIFTEFAENNIPFKTLFTGQHLDLIDPNHQADYTINIKDTSNNRLDTIISQILSTNFKNILKNIKSIMVMGDTTSALAISLIAFNNKIPLMHLEAGLRTYNNYNPFPEEMNRQLISRMSDIHFCPTINNKKFLERESVNGKKYVVGNTVIDNIKELKESTNYSNKVLITMHRRENHDIIDQYFEEFEKMAKGEFDIESIFNKKLQKHENIRITDSLEFILPLHSNPNVQKYKNILKNVKIIDPMEYDDLIKLLCECRFVITDSGGIQEEATFLGKKVIICRKETERQEILERNGILCKHPKALERIYKQVVKNYKYDSNFCPFGEGDASQKISKIVKNLFYEDKKNKILLLLPVRKRPKNLIKFYKSWKENTTNGSEYCDVLVGIDEDNLDDYMDIPKDFKSIVLPVMKTVEKINYMADIYKDEYKYIGFVGDDVKILTKNFDVKIIKKMEKLISNGNNPNGHCIIFPNDLLRDDSPSHCIMTSKTIQDLGFMGPIKLWHSGIDTFWRDLCDQKRVDYEYSNDILFEHMHYVNNKSKHDELYKLAYSDEWKKHDKLAYDDFLKFDFDRITEKLISTNDIEFSSNISESILVCIPFYKNSNLSYLENIINELNSTKYNIDIYILSNTNIISGHKILNLSNVKFVYYGGLKDPDLAFKIRNIFHEFRNEYMYFIYTEPAHLITEENLNYFIKFQKDVPFKYILGHLQYEIYENKKFYPSMQSVYRWENKHIYDFNTFIGAQYTNAYQGSLFLTRDQLLHCLDTIDFFEDNIRSGYGKKARVSTDIYTHCGFIKLIPISHLSKFEIQHLPNNSKEFGGKYFNDIQDEINTIMKKSKKEPLNENISSNC